MLEAMDFQCPSRAEGAAHSTSRWRQAADPRCPLASVLTSHAAHFAFQTWVFPCPERNSELISRISYQLIKLSFAPNQGQVKCCQPSTPIPGHSFPFLTSRPFFYPWPVWGPRSGGVTLSSKRPLTYSPCP